MSNISDKALAFLSAIMKQATINCDTNTDEQALEVQVLYPNWEDIQEGAELSEGKRVNYENVLYNILTTHNKQNTWTPENSPSLYAKVLIPDSNVIPEWEQPDSTNAYMKGDKVTHNGSVWESLVDNNTWEPGVVGTESLWKKVEE